MTYSEINKLEFLGLLGSQSLVILSSFTDVTGESPLGYGHPYTETTYATRTEKPVLKEIRSKDHAKDKSWNVKYYKLC